MALAFLIHFVGDLAPADACRRPCRSGRQQGRGQLRDHRRPDQFAQHLGRVARRTRRFRPRPPVPAALLAQVSPAERERIASGSVEDWSREMWGKARELAYQTPGRRSVRRDAGRTAGHGRGQGSGLIPVVRAPGRRSKAESGWRDCSMMRLGRRPRRPARSAASASRTARWPRPRQAQLASVGSA